MRLPTPMPPTFDLNRCETSGWCVAVCPTNCLDLWKDSPYLRIPDDCISCGACVEVCPVDAVVLTESAAPSEPHR